MTPTLKTLEEAHRAANSPVQYRGLTKKEADDQQGRARTIGAMLNSAKIARMANR